MGIYDAVTERLRDLAHQKRYSMNKLADISGISSSTLKSILYGNSKNPGIVTLKKLCDGLEISIVDFFDTETFQSLEQEIK